MRRFDAFTASVEELYFDMGVPLSGKYAIISGVGSSDAGPLYQTWASLYSAVHPRVKVDYQPLGAGRGMQQLTEGATTFGATDVPLSEEQLSVFRKAGGRVLQLPAAMNAVVLIQNLSEAAIGLQLTPEAAAGIYLGTIKTWRDPAISGSNPGIELPDTPIRPIYRSDASGFTDAFTNYLAGGSNTWRNEVGVGLSPKWPVGTGARGDAGIAATVAETKGSIGYVSFSYAVQNHLTGDRLANRQKLFVPATVASIAAAAQNAEIPADFRISLKDPPNRAAYPISTFTWLVLPFSDDPKTHENALLALDFFQWALGQGRAQAEERGFVALPEPLASRARTAVRNDYR